MSASCWACDTVALTAFGEVSSEARANLVSLRQALHEDKSQPTTQPSTQMIDAASAGCCPEPLCDLLSHLRLDTTCMQNCDPALRFWSLPRIRK